LQQGVTNTVWHDSFAFASAQQRLFFAFIQIAIGPGYRNERNDPQRRDRLTADVRFDQMVQHFFISNTTGRGQGLLPLLVGQRAAQCFQQLSLSLRNKRCFQRTSLFVEKLVGVIGHNNSLRASVRCQSRKISRDNFIRVCVP
jgi:hypothetical protein